MRLALLTTDNRQNYGTFHSAEPGFGTAPEALLQGLADRNDVEVHVVSCLQQPVRSPEKLAKNIWFHALHVPKPGWMRSGYAGCIAAVRSKLRTIQPDIVHGQGTERDCALSAVFSGFPSILTVHGNMRLIARINRARPFSFQWLASKLERLTLPRARGVVCITNYTREAVKGIARRTWIVPNAVDKTFFDVVRQPSSPPTLLCVGYISHRKNQNAFIRAIDPIAATRPLHLRFLGSASVHERGYSTEFFRLAEERPWVDYAGFADRELLRSHLSTSAMLVLPSLEDNCPMTVLEAMAAGVPVLASRVGGLPDLIDDAVTGKFCDPLDAVSMRAGVEYFLENASRAGAIAKQAQTRAHERFHPQTIASQHIGIYREVLSTCS